MNARILLSLTLALSCLGCADSPGSSKQRLKGALDAALAIAASSTRDGALEKVALEAAGEGVGEVVKQAVEAIASSSLKDGTAADCAVKLAEAGETSAATEVAKLIASSSLRDSVLGKIAVPK